MPTTSQLHAGHDRVLVAALAAGDLAGGERDSAVLLVARCADCRSLHDDLLAIARTTAGLPPAARPRDFRLSPEQAARLRPAGWRRLAAFLASPRLSVARPLGLGLTTIGLAGLLFTTLPAVLPQVGAGGAATALSTVGSSVDVTGEMDGSAAPASEPTVLGGGAGPVASDAAPSAGTPGAVGAPVPPGAEPAPQPSGDRNQATEHGVEGAPGDTSASPGAVEQLRAGLDEPTAGPDPVLVASLVLLAGGVGLLALRALARRLAAS